MLADGLLLVRLARTSGVYLALALEASVAVAAMVVVGSTISRHIRRLRAEAHAGRYNPYRYALLATCIAAGVLMVIPGFVSDIVGLAIYLPPGRHLAAWILHRRNREGFGLAYEYLKLRIFSVDEQPERDE